MKNIRTSICSILCAATLVLLSACGNTGASQNTVASASDRQVTSASVSTATSTSVSASTSDSTMQTDSTSSVEEKNESKPEPTETVVYGEKKDDLTYVVITINPEILVGINAEGKVEYVENLNDDGADVLTTLLSDSNEEKFENVEKFMGEYLTTVVDKGYGDKEDFKITVDSYDEGVKSEEVVNQVAASIANAIPEDKLEAENVKFIVEDEPEEVWITCPDCSYGFAVCRHCNGNWEKAELLSKAETCDVCKGTGTVTTTESRTVSVYNGTPCKICGDVGTVDDGKHGGQRALCGECVGYGKSHSVGDIAPQEGGYSGVYASYAFSEKEITEEHTEACGKCNGTGTCGETLYGPCYHCSYGTILCPTCKGAGGRFESR